jgi:hypothetical protein
VGEWPAEPDADVEDAAGSDEAEDGGGDPCRWGGPCPAIVAAAAVSLMTFWLWGLMPVTGQSRPEGAWFDPAAGVMSANLHDLVLWGTAYRWYRPGPPMAPGTSSTTSCGRWPGPPQAKPGPVGAVLDAQSVKTSEGSQARGVDMGK